MSDAKQNIPEHIFKIDVHRIGLPLSTKGFISVCTTLIIFIILQYKLSNTFLAEGTLAVLAIISYILVRIFFLRSEYEKELGAIEVTKHTIAFPRCLSLRREAIEASRDSIKWIKFYRMKRRGNGHFLTSIEFMLKSGTIVYSNLFTNNLESLKEALKAKEYKFEEAESPTYKKLLILFIIAIVIGFTFLISKLVSLR